MKFDYTKEPRRDVLCIDVKSFYASVECIDLGHDPMTTMLVVMSKPENRGGLVMAASPTAKKRLGISNVTRKYDLPNHPELIVVSPHMKRYIEKNSEINSIYRQFVADEDLHIYSIDESFLDVTASYSLFGKTAYDIARKIQTTVKNQTGLIVTIGIGDNPLLAKLALDNAAKHQPDGIAQWHYEEVPQTVWKIHPFSDMWGIGHKTVKNLEKSGINSVYDLAHSNFYVLKEKFGITGEQLYALAWGIDRSRLRDKYIPTEKSFGNSQILDRDYTKQTEIETVIREMADQVGARLREHHCQTECIQLQIGFSYAQLTTGFTRQLKIPATSQSQRLAHHLLQLFRTHYHGEVVRRIGVSYSRLVYSEALQLNLFEAPEKQVAQDTLDKLVDKIRNKYGFSSLIHASSLTDGSTAVHRSTLLGGHAKG